MPVQVKVFVCPGSGEEHLSVCLRQDACDHGIYRSDVCLLYWAHRHRWTGSRTQETRPVQADQLNSAQRGPSERWPVRSWPVSGPGEPKNRPVNATMPTVKVNFVLCANSVCSMWGRLDVVPNFAGGTFPYNLASAGMLELSIVDRNSCSWNYDEGYTKCVWTIVRHLDLGLKAAAQTSNGYSTVTVIKKDAG